MKIRYIYLFFAIIIILGSGIWLSSELGLFATTGRRGFSALGSGRGRQSHSLSTGTSAEKRDYWETHTFDLITTEEGATDGIAEREPEIELFGAKGSKNTGLS